MGIDLPVVFMGAIPGHQIRTPRGRLPTRLPGRLGVEKHEERAEQLEREAERMEKESERVDGVIGEARSDWESKEADQMVPGAQSDLSEIRQEAEEHEEQEQPREEEEDQDDSEDEEDDDE
jgi:hypothetical protein